MNDRKPVGIMLPLVAQGSHLGNVGWKMSVPSNDCVLPTHSNPMATVMQNQLSVCATDQLLASIPWIFAGIVFLFVFKSPRSWKRIGFLAIIMGFSSAAILTIYVRPNILRQQMSAFASMEQRLMTAEQHFRVGRLQAAETLLFQVSSEAIEIQSSKLTLPEARKRSQLVQQIAEECGAKIKRRFNDLASRLGESLQRRDFHDSVAILESERLDSKDFIGAVLQDFLWHVVNDEITAAEKCLSMLSGSGTALNLQQLRQVISSERNAIQTRHASIAQTVKDLVDSASYYSPGFRPIRKGRAMVWDFTKDSIEGAYQLLPDELRATSRDGLLTMFCIRKREQNLVGHYTISGAPAYREKMEIAVVYWPTRACVGATTIYGGDPRSVRKVTSAPEYGSSIQIKEWIESLPEDSASAMPKAAIHSIEELRAYLAAEKVREQAERAQEAHRKSQLLAEEETRRSTAAKQAEAKRKSEQAAAEERRLAAIKADAEEAERRAVDEKAKLQKMAISKLKLAKTLLDKNQVAATKRLEEVVRDYPDTEAATEAEALLKKLKLEPVSKPH